MIAHPLAELPHPAGRVPILGDIRSVDRHRPTQHEAKLVDELGPIYQRKLLGERLIVVGGGELGRQCLSEESWGRVLVGPVARLRAVGGSGLFTARTSDPLWGQARRILTPGFSAAAMRAYHLAMESVADDLADKWMHTQSAISVHDDMTAATLEVIGRAGFSEHMGLLGPKSAGGRDTARFLSALSRTLEWASTSTNDLPIIGSLREAMTSQQRRRDIDFARSYIDAIVEARASSNLERADDLLSLMLGTTDPQTGSQLPRDNIRDQVLTFLVAGHETTAALMEVALFYLATQPEVSELIARSIEGPMTFDAISKNRTVRAFLNECLRLWPPVPGFFRISREDQTLGGYEMPAGRAVFVLALAAQRDRSDWGPTAHEFDPTRFLNTRITNSSGKFFAPWGTGPRSCIGRQFALHEAALLIASIASRFRISTSARSAEHIKMRERGTLRPEEFLIDVQKRT